MSPFQGGGVKEATRRVRDAADEEARPRDPGDGSPAGVTPGPETTDVPDPLIKLDQVELFYGASQALKGITLKIPQRQVTAFIGPSGCGKSTFLRCLNRMHELSDGGWVTGRVLLDGVDIYGTPVDPVQVRRRVGMVFQRPTPFPTMSIFDNVAAGLRIGRATPRSTLADQVEQALRRAALWDEVKDRLHSSALALSGGQQQRLCIARAVAPQPDAREGHGVVQELQRIALARRPARPHRALARAQAVEPEQYCSRNEHNRRAFPHGRRL